MLQHKRPGAAGGFALTARIDALAHTLAGMAPLTLRATKEQLRRPRETIAADAESDAPQVRQAASRRLLRRSAPGYS